MVEDTSSEERLAVLRRSLVKELQRQGAVRSTALAAAFQAVRRHLFLPSHEPEAVYKDFAIATRWRRGAVISSSSQPAIMALMLEQLSLEPGMRVLEVGAGTGYNAALIQYLVGEAGRVVTVDIDPEVAEWARERLSAAGWPEVEVVAGDGGHGWAPGAPYDRIIVTASCWQVPEPWVEQLRDGGVMVLPLRLNLATVSVALRKEGQVLRSLSCLECGFMPLQGSFARQMGGRVPGQPTVRCWTDWPSPRLHRGHMAALLREEPRLVEDPRLVVERRSGWGGLWYFLALQGEPLVHLLLLREDGGLDPFFGVFDTRESSGVLFPPGDPGRLRIYGSDAAADRLRAHAEAWRAAGSPEVTALTITAEPSPRRGPALPRPCADRSYRSWRGGRLFSLLYRSDSA